MIRHRDTARRLLPLAWPLFVGQVAVLAFATVDTIVVARRDAIDLAALAIGGAAYGTVFVGLMGTVLAVGPIAGQLYGARRLEECGAQLHQGVWLGLALSLLGMLVLLFPDPFLALAQADAEVASRSRAHLAALAFALPPALAFTAFRAFNTAVSRPKIVMLLQLGGLTLKVPLAVLLVHGEPALHLPALGVVGCGASTAIVMWLQFGVAGLLLRRDPFYARFGIARRLARPDPARLKALLRLGIPMGGSILTEVSGFTFMTFFISRVGATPVAAHHIAVNIVTLMFMLSLAIASASSTLVAQRIGAGDLRDARRIGWHGLQIGTGVAALVAATVFVLRGPILAIYTRDVAVLAIALPLLAWVALFHVVDAAQTVAAFVLRAWRVATVPLIVYAVALWGIGIGGGNLLAFGWSGVPAWLGGTFAFWAASTAGLAVAALALGGYLVALSRRQGVPATT